MPQEALTDVIGYKKFSRTISDISNKPRNRTYSMIIFSLLAVTLLGWFAIRPTIRTILQLRREIEDKSKLNKKMDDKIASLIQAQEAYFSVQPKLQLISQAVPTNPEVISLMRALRQIEGTSGIKTTDVHFSNVALASSSGQVLLKNLANFEQKTTSESTSENQAFTTSFIISSKATGTYDVIHSYLDAIGHMRRITEITALDIKPQSQSNTTDEGGIGGLLEVSMQLSAYYGITSND